MGKKVVLMSGGNDSARIAEMLSEEHDSVTLVFIDYGQKSAKWEYRAAKKIARYLKMKLDRMDLRKVYKGTGLALLTGKHVETIKETIVPGRNLLFLSAVAARYDALWDGEEFDVYLGVHKSTIEDMPDCCDSFIDVATTAITFSSSYHAHLIVPFITQYKRDILCSPVIRRMTYTCYEGKKGGCGRCIACKTMKQYM